VHMPAESFVSVSAEFLVDDDRAMEAVTAALGKRPNVDRQMVEREHGSPRLLVSFAVLSERDVIEAATGALDTVRAVAAEAGLSTDCEAMWSVRVSSEQTIAVAGGRYTRGEAELMRAADASNQEA
jgi:hypothetical protein